VNDDVGAGIFQLSACSYLILVTSGVLKPSQCAVIASLSETVFGAKNG
jgi:hypothetical protein